MDEIALQTAGQEVASLVSHLQERREYRDWLIQRAIEEGVPYRRIAEMAGVTVGRVGQIATMVRFGATA